MKLSHIIILLLISSVAFCQSNPTPITTWKIYPVPKNNDTLYKYNSYPYDWYIFEDSNKIYVENLRDRYNRQQNPFTISPEIGEERILQAKRYSIIEVDDGFLIAYNRGEFGGLIYWVSKDKKANYKIAAIQISQFIKRDNKLYALEGVAHGYNPKGSIVSIEKQNGKWMIIDYLKLSSVPEAAQLDSKNNLIVVTSSSLLSIDNNKKNTFLIKEGIWSALLYPSSIVIQNDIVYIGMRKGVFKYNLLTKEDGWLLPD